MDQSMPMDAQTDTNTTTETETPDDSQGYQLCVQVLPGGKFVISKEALESVDQEQAEHETQPNTIGAASEEEMLKTIVGLIRDNPVGGDTEETDMMAGYGGAMNQPVGARAGNA